MERLRLTLVTGNSSWWKQRKYRRETARELRRLRLEGWRFVTKERLSRQGVTTRRYTAYVLERQGAADAAGAWQMRRL